jgi:hypothetical protein
MNQDSCCGGKGSGLEKEGWEAGNVDWESGCSHYLRVRRAGWKSLLDSERDAPRAPWWHSEWETDSSQVRTS